MGSYISVHVSEYVDVPVKEVLEDIDTDDLVKELAKRQIAASAEGVIDSDWLERLMFFLERKELHAAIALVHAAMSPVRNRAAVAVSRISAH